MTVSARRVVTIACALAAPVACRESLHPPSTLGPGFTDITPELPATFPNRVRPGEDPVGTAGLFVDLDGDGQRELVLTSATDDTPADGNALVFRLDPGTQRFAPGRDIPLTNRTLVLATADLDDDGAPDLVASRRQPLLAWGSPGGGFGAPVPLASSSLDPRSTEVISVALDDLDDDGWLDVLVGNHQCCSTCLALHPFLRTGRRVFVDRADLVTDNPSGGPYALLAGSFGPGERLLGSIGAGCTSVAPSFFRATRGADGLPRFDPFDPTPPDAVYRSESSSDHPCPSIACRAPMGAAAGDLDGDGWIDLAISFNPFHGVFRGGSAWPLADHSEDTDFQEISADSGASMLPWGTALLDLDQDGRADVVTVHGDDHTTGTDPSRAIGPQHVTAHWNGGEFRFAEVTSLTHLDRRGQWRALFVGDLDRDGDPDLVVGGVGLAPRVYRNDIVSGHAGLALQLHGTSSNALGIGARVRVWPLAAGPAQLFVVGGTASPYVVSEPLVFVGLGAARSAARVQVTWPAGTVQELRDLRAGAVHTLEEPPLFVVSPVDRHVPADGRSEATLRITPRALDGSVRPGARVEVALAYGTGSLAAPPAWSEAEGAWVVRVVAPAAPGAGVVTLRVDGVPAGVRPRIWWDPAPP